MPLPPGPRLPSILQAAVFLRDPIGFQRRCQARYGDCFSARFPGMGLLVYVADPGEVKRLLSGDPEVFHAGEGNSPWLEPVVGRHSLLTIDEDEHMRQRKILMPPFHRAQISRYEAIFSQVAAAELERWPLDRPFPLRPAMQRITLEVIQRAVIGINDPDRLRAFTEAILGLEAVASPVVLIPPLRRSLGRFSPWRRFLHAREAVDELIYEEIGRRRASPDQGDDADVLSLLLRARHPDGTGMSDVELRDQIMSAFAAGYETTATALAWSFERVLRTPAVLERVVASPDDDDYLDAVVKETLRMRAPVNDGGTRYLTADVEISGYSIPAGSLVLAAPGLVHFRPDVWPAPDAFRPERFLDGNPAPFTYVPFGGGVRRCIGAAFAQLEMKVVLRTVFERVRLRAASPKPETPRMHHVVIVPARGARAVVTERLPTSSRDGLRGGRGSREYSTRGPVETAG
jgi:cytochrome P450 family 135